MKVLFLDIDGVLVPFDSTDISPGPLEQLRRIHEATSCQIVLSSSWRAFKPRIARINRCLKEIGLPPLIDKTPQLGLDRPKEIVTWLENHEADRAFRAAKLTEKLKANPDHRRLQRELEEVGAEKVTHWVALDDMELSSFDSRWGHAMRGHFVLTELDVGLEEPQADLAIRILSGARTEEDCAKERKELEGRHLEFLKGES